MDRRPRCEVEKGQVGGILMEEVELASFAVGAGIRGGAEDVAATCIREDTRMIRFSNNKVTVNQAWLSSTVNIMVAFKKRVVIGSVEDLSRGSVSRSVDYLLRIVKATKPKRDYVKLPRGPFKYAAPQPCPPPPEGSVMMRHVKDAIDGALSRGARRVAGTLLYRKVETDIATSAGASGRDVLSSFEISVRAFSDGNSSGHANSCARTEEDFQPAQAGEAAAEMAVKAVNPVQGESGVYDVVLGPNVFANLMNDVVNAASAFNVDAALSFMVGKLGKRIASRSLTLIDDGTLPDGLNSRSFDDEGVPTRRTTIIERGVLRSYLHNSSTARKYKCSTTGNAGWIVPQPWNIVVEAGQLSEERVLQELDDGLYVTNNWYTRFHDYRRGDFSTVCRDALLRVKGGKIIQSLKGLRISGNLPKILRNISALSDKRYWVKWWEVDVPTLTPYALVREVPFTRSTK
ncbi:MAG: TldD/PmbA family protein [Candidatus Bathyarchaeia archaeon]